MRWLPGPTRRGFELVTPPTETLPLADVRDFLGYRSQDTAADGQLRAIIPAVVQDAEYEIRGAVYPQVRRYTATFGWCEMERRRFEFEPFRDSADTHRPVVLLNGDPLAHSVAGNTIELDEPLYPKRGDMLSFELSVGFDLPLPDTLRTEMMIEVQRKMERFRQVQTNAESPVLIPRGQGIRMHKSFNEPLSTELVEVGDGLA